MPRVKVNRIPVRYNGKTYKAGEEFEMRAEYVNENLVSIVAEKKEEKKAPKNKE